MSEPIVARINEPPKPVRPTLYIMIDPEPNISGIYGTTCASPSPFSGYFSGIAVVVPGSEEVWTEDRVRMEAVLLMQDWRCSKLDDALVSAMKADLIERFVTFARTLGSLEERTATPEAAIASTSHSPHPEKEITHD